MQSGVRIIDAYVVVDGQSRRLREGDNLHAAEALFMVDRP